MSFKNTLELICDKRNTEIDDLKLFQYYFDNHIEEIIKNNVKAYLLANDKGWMKKNFTKIDFKKFMEGNGEGHTQYLNFKNFFNTEFIFRVKKFKKDLIIKENTTKFIVKNIELNKDNYTKYVDLISENLLENIWSLKEIEFNNKDIFDLLSLFNLKINEKVNADVLLKKLSEFNNIESGYENASKYYLNVVSETDSIFLNEINELKKKLIELKTNWWKINSVVYNNYIQLSLLNFVINFRNDVGILGRLISDDSFPMDEKKQEEQVFFNVNQDFQKLLDKTFYEYFMNKERQYYQKEIHYTLWSEILDKLKDIQETSKLKKRFNELDMSAKKEILEFLEPMSEVFFKEGISFYEINLIVSKNMIDTNLKDVKENVSIKNMIFKSFHNHQILENLSSIDRHQKVFQDENGYRLVELYQKEFIKVLLGCEIEIDNFVKELCQNNVLTIKSRMLGDVEYLECSLEDKNQNIHKDFIRDLWVEISKKVKDINFIKEKEYCANSNSMIRKTAQYKIKNIMNKEIKANIIHDVLLIKREILLQARIKETKKEGFIEGRKLKI